MIAWPEHLIVHLELVTRQTLANSFLLQFQSAKFTFVLFLELALAHFFALCLDLLQHQFWPLQLVFHCQKHSTVSRNSDFSRVLDFERK